MGSSVKLINKFGSNPKAEWGGAGKADSGKPLQARGGWVAFGKALKAVLSDMVAMN